MLSSAILLGTGLISTTMSVIFTVTGQGQPGGLRVLVYLAAAIWCAMFCYALASTRHPIVKSSTESSRDQ